MKKRERIKFAAFGMAAMMIMGSPPWNLYNGVVMQAYASENTTTIAATDTSGTSTDGTDTSGTSTDGTSTEDVAKLYQYDVTSDNTVEITGYSGTDTDIVIPGEIEGRKVTSIGGYVFFGCSSLTSVDIPEGVTSIGDSAFYNCSRLTSVVIPEGVTSIGDSAFTGCSSLTSVVIPEGVTSIGWCAFFCCSSLTSVNIPEGVTSIESSAFSGCSSLTSVVIPEGVTSIGDWAFSGCSSLTSVDILEGVTSIEAGAFAGCNSLTAINVSSGNQFYSSKEGVLFNADGTTLLAYPNGQGGMYVIPEGVTSIGGYAFYNCSSLTSVVIPEGVTSIGGWAFYNCSNLTSVDILEGVTSIGDWAFYGCNNLTSIRIPKSVTTMSDRAVGYDSEGRFIPNFVIYGYIGSAAEAYVKDVIAGNEGCNWSFIPIIEATTTDGIYVEYVPDAVAADAVITLETKQLAKEDEAYDSIVLTGKIVAEGVKPEDVKFIAYDITLKGNGVSIQPSGIVTVKVPVPEGFDGSRCRIYHVDDKGGLTDMNARFADGMIEFATTHFSTYLITETELRTVPDGTSTDGTSTDGTSTDGTSTDGTSTDGTSTDGQYKVGNSTYKYVQLSDNTVEITGYSGTDTDIVIPGEIEGRKVTSIGMSAFRGCSSLTSVVIPEGVTSIKLWAFSRCNSLTAINVSSGNQFYSSKDGVLFSADGTTLLAHPNKKGNTYIIPEGVTSIGVSAFEGCSSLTSVVIPESVTSIGVSAFEGCSSLTSVNIPEGVTSIGSFAFSGCSSLTSVNIPERVTSIGVAAFEGCSSLTSVVIPEGVTSIEDSAFSFCSSLTSVNIPEGVTSIGNGAFSGCSSLTSVDIPEGVTSIENHAFLGCNSLTSVDIPEGVTSIGVSAFEGCSSLTSVDIPEGVTSIEWFAFRLCSSLTSIRIPEGVTSIGYWAFEGCSSLTSVVIPEGVTSIGDWAFYGCNNLTSIRIPKSVTTMSDRAVGYGSEGRFIPNFIIQGYIGSAAEAYVKDVIAGNEGCNWSFIPIIEATTTDGIYVEYVPDAVAADVAITLETKQLAKEDEAYDSIVLTGKIVAEGVKPEDVKFIAYDITLKGNGVSIQPNGIVTVKVPVSEGFDGSRCRIYHVDGKGGLTDMNARFVDGMIEFVTTHFSTYLITETELRTVPDGTSTDGTSTDGTSTDGTSTDGTSTDGTSTDGTSTDGTSTDGTSTDGTSTDGTSTDGTSTDGTSTDGTSTDGTSTDGISGDANGDSTVNSKDVVMMKKHLAGYTVDIDLKVCDVNGDGAVNSKDVVLVMKKLAGYDVVLGKQ